MADDEELDLEDLSKTPAPDQEMTVPDDTETDVIADSFDAEDDTEIARTAADLEAVFDIPVHVTAVLGKSRMRVSQLLKLGRGAVIELDRKVGEAIDIYVNNRLVARGEVVVVEDRLGVTMTEIIKADRR
ncbi:flagellar motor switch protein FliN [Sneathiella sp.]|uniref:flagellar motor switch protein FliN n=1 Tax=Sneathiella sp. TaxID=1964365 RepID=UPI0025EEDA61|nr:flagellar motor switch protein FliN [Sneathiella sp.]